jgi:hypothetical protein
VPVPDWRGIVKRILDKAKADRDAEKNANNV